MLNWLSASHSPPGSTAHDSSHEAGKSMVFRLSSTTAANTPSQVKIPRLSVERLPNQVANLSLIRVGADKVAISGSLGVASPKLDLFERQSMEEELNEGTDEDREKYRPHAYGATEGPADREHKRFDSKPSDPNRRSAF